MAITEDRILANINIDLIVNAINVRWADRVLRDGVVVAENSHNGSYPVNEQMEVDDYVQTLLGASLQDIIGEAGAEAQKKLLAADALIPQIMERAEQAESQLRQLQQLYITLQQQLLESQQQTLEAVNLNQQLLNPPEAQNGDDS